MVGQRVPPTRYGKEPRHGVLVPVASRELTQWQGPSW